VSSSGELRTALDAGTRPDRVLHTGPGKTDQEIRDSLAAGIRLFSVESTRDRDRLSRLAMAAGAACDYLVRLNHPSGQAGSLRMTGRPTPFGVDTDDRTALAALLCPADAVTPVGLHTYFATNVEESEAVAKEFEQAIDTVADVSRAATHTPRILDLGGGFAAPMARSGQLNRHHHVARTVEKALARHWPTSARPTLVFESGRYLVGAAGWLLTRVLDMKRVRGRRYAVLDAGTHVLGGMSGLGRLLAPKAVPNRLGSSDAAGTMTSLVGPLCTPLDVLHPDVSLPDDVDVGSLLTIPNVGAYGLTASLLGFLSHPIAVEVVHDAGEVVSARRLVIDAVDLLSKEHDHA